MIDIESKVFNAVYTACRAIHSGCVVSGEYVLRAAQYPFIEFVQIDNYVHDPSVTLDRLENHAHVVFEANVYSNLMNGKKSQAKQFMQAIDGVMSGYGFKRIMISQIPNIDSTICRMTGRWEGIVSAGETKNQNTIHTIYNT